MLMADALVVTLVIVGFLLAFPALWLVWRALAPRSVELASQRCVANPIKSVLLGLVMLGGTVLVAGVVGGAGVPGNVIAVAVVCCYVLWAHLGVAGFVTHLGRRLPSPADAERPWKATLRGGVALELTYLLPLLGWFGILPLSWVCGAGAATLAQLDKVKASLRVPAPTPAQPAPVEPAPEVVESAPVLEAAR